MRGTDDVGCWGPLGFMKSAMPWALVSHAFLGAVILGTAILVLFLSQSWDQTGQRVCDRAQIILLLVWWFLLCEQEAQVDQQHALGNSPAVQPKTGGELQAHLLCIAHITLVICCSTSCESFQHLWSMQWSFKTQWADFPSTLQSRVFWEKGSSAQRLMADKEEGDYYLSPVHHFTISVSSCCPKNTNRFRNCAF